MATTRNYNTKYQSYISTVLTVILQFEPLALIRTYHEVCVINYFITHFSRFRSQYQIICHNSLRYTPSIYDT